MIMRNQMPMCILDFSVKIVTRFLKSKRIGLETCFSNFVYLFFEQKNVLFFGFTFDEVATSADKRVIASDRNEKRVENHSFSFKYEFICIHRNVIRSHSFTFVHIRSQVKSQTQKSSILKFKVFFDKEMLFYTKLKDEACNMTLERISHVMYHSSFDL